jgi:DNA-binding MarR family transcriptional regulator
MSGEARSQRFKQPSAGADRKGIRAAKRPPLVIEIRGCSGHRSHLGNDVDDQRLRANQTEAAFLRVLRDQGCDQFDEFWRGVAYVPEVARIDEQDVGVHCDVEWTLGIDHGSEGKRRCPGTLAVVSRAPQQVLLAPMSPKAAAISRMLDPPRLMERIVRSSDLTVQVLDDHAQRVPTSRDHATENAWWESVATSALLRAAFRSYGDVVRTAVAAAGFDDLPRNGAYVIGATARSSLAMQHLPSALGVTKQAFSQLVDTLVLRGYVDRAADPEDRRRLRLALTERGSRVSDLIDDCARRSDEALLALVEDPDKIATTRWVLAKMTEIPADLEVER